MGQNRRRQILIGSVVLVILLMMTMLANMTGMFHVFDPFDKRPFSSETWLATTREDRAPMARDLVKNHLPAGLSVSDVVAFLGPPDRIITGSSASIRPGCSKALTYYLGCWSEYGMDAAFVYVHIDNNDKVVLSEIIGG
jgi:hypothetical protein